MDGLCLSSAGQRQAIYTMNIKLLTLQVIASLGLAWQLHAAPPTINPGEASPDLAHWQFRNQVLQLTNVENLRRGWALERPKVFPNAKTGKFVMYFHLD